MKKGQYNKILQTIANKEGISAEEVEMEMQTAIYEAFSKMDKMERKKWSKISRNGEPPTLEEFIEYMAELIKVFQSLPKH